jgi:hypothetical protein
MPRLLTVAVLAVVGGVASTSCGGPAREPATPSSTPGQLTLSGLVRLSRVEGRCLTLKAGGTVYLLVGATAGVVADSQQKITGHLAPELKTTCQTGVPFVVERVARIAGPSAGYVAR